MAHTMVTRNPECTEELLPGVWIRRIQDGERLPDWYLQSHDNAALAQWVCPQLTGEESKIVAGALRSGLIGTKMMRGAIASFFGMKARMTGGKPPIGSSWTHPSMVGSIFSVEQFGKTMVVLVSEREPGNRCYQPIESWPGAWVSIGAPKHTEDILPMSWDRISLGGHVYGFDWTRIARDCGRCKGGWVETEIQGVVEQCVCGTTSVLPLCIVGLKRGWRMRRTAVAFQALTEAMSTPHGKRVLAAQAIEKAVREAPPEFDKTALLAWMTRGIETRHPDYDHASLAWIQDAMFHLRFSNSRERRDYLVILGMMRTPPRGRPTKPWWERNQERPGAVLRARVPASWRS